MHKYKNVSGSKQIVVGAGVVEKDGELVTDKIIENPNFEYVGEAESTANINGVQHKPQPGAVTEAEKVETDNGQSA